MRAYERAKMSREKDVACAYHLREVAKAKLLADVRAREAAFISAAMAFLHSAGESADAEEIVAYHRIAADCYAAVGDQATAARYYLLAKEFTQSAMCYRKAGLFDDAVGVIQNNHDDVYKEPDSEDANVADSIIDVAKLHYLKKNQLE